MKEGFCGVHMLVPGGAVCYLYDKEESWEAAY